MIPKLFENAYLDGKIYWIFSDPPWDRPLLVMSSTLLLDLHYNVSIIINTYCRRGFNFLKVWSYNAMAFWDRNLSGNWLNLLHWLPGYLQSEDMIVFLSSLLNMSRPICQKIRKPPFQRHVKLIKLSVVRTFVWHPFLHIYLVILSHPSLMSTCFRKAHLWQSTLHLLSTFI